MIHLIVDIAGKKKEKKNEKYPLSSTEYWFFSSAVFHQIPLKHLIFYNSQVMEYFQITLTFFLLRIETKKADVCVADILYNSTVLCEYRTF